MHPREDRFILYFPLFSHGVRALVRTHSVEHLLLVGKHRAVIIRSCIRLRRTHYTFPLLD